MRGILRTSGTTYSEVDIKHTSEIILGITKAHRIFWMVFQALYTKLYTYRTYSLLVIYAWIVYRVSKIK